MRQGEKQRILLLSSGNGKTMRGHVTVVRTFLIVADRHLRMEPAGADGPFAASDLPKLPASLPKMKLPTPCAALSNPQRSELLQSWLLRVRMSLFKTVQARSQQAKPATPPKPPKNESTIITLIRPKGATLPEPPPRPKKQKKKPEYLLNPPVPIKRSRSAILPPPRNIHTPDWCDASFEELAPVAVGPFDIPSAHRILEICESRIQRGEDPAHRHPALARVASTDDMVLSAKEVEMGERYAEVRTDELVPGFWPERVWDRDQTRMNEAETERLRQRLENILLAENALLPSFAPKLKRASSTAPVRKASTKAGRQKFVSRKGSEMTVVSVDFRNFQTDNEETDWEDF